MAKKRFWIVINPPLHLGSIFGPVVVSEETKRKLQQANPDLRFRPKK